MATKQSLKKHLSIEGLLSATRKIFSSVKDPLNSPEKDPRGKKTQIPLVDCLMSGLAVFGLKFPSLFQFSNDREAEITKHNLKTLYKIEHAPCDTYMRERLDEVDPKEMRKAFTTIFARAQRDKVLEDYQYLYGHYLLLNDGTGVFESDTVHCKNCCVKEHKDGRISYYHQVLGAVIAHPDKKEVLPICPEPIMKRDGSKKNDCERNASKRLLEDFRREHPHLKVILCEDALAANGPHLELLKKLNIRFIVNVKPDGNKSLFDWVSKIKGTEVIKKDKKKGISWVFTFHNDIPLNDTYPNLLVNLLICKETLADGTTKTFTWITDIKITESNVYDLMRGGRTRWKIENETFNTLKNQGYQFEHNFGHGNKNLNMVFTMLMFLAFAIDQLQQISCAFFQAALKKAGSRIALWQKIKSLFTTYYINSWQDLFESIAFGHKGAQLAPDTS
jgi:hypothetical protein